MVELRSVGSKELRELAARFRKRADEAMPGHYHDLMLRTAAELDARAQSLDASGGIELMLLDTEDGGCAS
jgi:hypothetical protein